MTLEKAIEIKTGTVEEFLKTSSEKIAEANRLSIEAMSLITLSRKLWGNLEVYQLPSETKE